MGEIRKITFQTTFILVSLGLFTFHIQAQDVGSGTDKPLVRLQEQMIQLERNSARQQEPGWKWLKRYEEFHTRRANPGGVVADPSIFLQEATKVARDKQMAPQRVSGVFNWFPVGPVTRPGSPISSLQPGMGRINTIEFHPSDSNTFWVGIAQGGVWKTTDGGQSWMPLTDNLPILRISDIAVNPSNTNEIYICVGDYAYLGVGLELDDRKRYAHYGLGVYKTTDGGQTWNPTGLTFNQTEFDASLMRAVYVDPANGQNLVAGGISGLYTSSDAGASWSQVNDSLVWDLIQNPMDPHTLYAATGYVKNLDLGHAGILKSTDFGVSWVTLNTGIPTQNQLQRIKLAIAPTDTSYIYGLACDLDRGFYGLYQSTNAGQTWSQQSTSPNILHWGTGTGNTGQGTYDLSLIVDASDPQRIYSGGINIWGSTDGGQNWDPASYWTAQYGLSIHADHHYFAYNPLNQYYYMCHDGGLSRTRQIDLIDWNSINSGASWTTVWEDLSNMQITSYYRFGLCQSQPEHLVAGSQDNSTFHKTPVQWQVVTGGDGMDCLMDPVNPDILYTSSQYGNFYKSTDGGQNFNGIGFNINEQGAWTTPITMDANNSDLLYLGYGNVWFSVDAGDSWTKISNLPDVPGWGYPVPMSALEVAGNHIYAAQRIYHSVGEPSRLWKSINQSTMINITAGLPDSLFFTSIDAVETSPATVFVTTGGYVDGVKIFKSTDAGSSWQNISLNLPNIPVNVVKNHDGSPYNTVYLGTDVGVYYTNDTLNQWVLFSQDLPNVIVSDLQIDEVNQKLYASTFGRGIWAVDLISSVSGLDQSHETLIQLNPRVFPNPGSGVFWVEFEEVLKEDLQLEIRDVRGAVLRNESLEGLGSKRVNLQVELVPGLYYFILKSGTASQVNKVLVR